MTTGADNCFARDSFPTQLPMRATLSILTVGLLATSLEAQAPHRTSTRAAISADDLRSRLFLIAHDSMMGRLPGEAGNYKTAEYVASEFKRLGLEPAGENGTYLQTVPFVLMAPEAATYLETGGTRLALGTDLVPIGVATTVRSISNAPVIYGGPARDPSQWVSGDSAVGKVVVLDIRPGPDGSRSLRGLALRDPRFNRAALVAIVGFDLTGSEQRAAIMGGRLTINPTPNATAAPVAFISEKAAAALLGGDPSTMTPGAAGRTASGSIGYAPKQV